jgi:uncharacterized membrane protein (UPF0182 family)
MEEAGWRGGQGEDQPPASAHPQQPWWTNRWLWLAILGLILFASFNWIVTTYTEWLWFTEVSYESVWLKELGAQVISFLAFFVVAALVLLVNWHLARRRALRPSSAGVQMLTLPGVGSLVTAIALFMAFLMGQAAAVRWETFLRFVYRVPFGRQDPIYGQDLSFYLFELPVIRFLHGWFMPLIVITILGTVALYVVNNLPQFQNQRLELRAIPAALRRHAAILLTVFFLLWAAGYWIDTYDLLFSPRGVVFGAGYTDLNASLPALWIQLGAMVLVAVAVAVLVVRPDPRPALVAGSLWLLASIVAAGLYPGLLQRYGVEPNELARELPYIEYNIELTRLGFGLDEVNSRAFQPSPSLTQQDLDDNELALRNIRLWDYRPLLETYRQLQELRTYYRFNDVDIDRYQIDGELRQVMLSARELTKAGLTNPTWVNQKLEFTHGYGLVMNPVDRFTSQGRPEFFIRDLPPESTVGIETTRPEIYYGELTDDVVYAASGLEEFNYPSGDQNVYTSYTGTGGVPINSWLRRLAFALRFAETNLLLSEYVNVNQDTRAMMHRQIQQRVRHIAPFLWQDGDPYLVLADGELVWMIDAYTASSDFPYSQPYFSPGSTTSDSALADVTVPSGVNYIRNSVKVVVDAYDGTIDFYVVDPDDPLVQTYERAFPDLFQPLSEMPETLVRHMRYPVDLFLIQTRQYLMYHMQDPQVFYNEEDLWEIPNEIFDGNTQPIEPYYVTFSLPEEEGTEFLLIQPYTPSARNNMVAWLAARSDPPNYGELYAYELPKQELIFGPIQVEGRIDQETGISEQFSLWDQQGSRVIRGS